MRRLLLILPLLLAGCPDDEDPYDPSACDPRCSSGFQCYKGACRPLDGGGFVMGDGTLDGDPVNFDALSVQEGGQRGWHKNSFSHLDTELVSKDDGVNLSNKGMRLEVKWDQYGANLLKNPGFETGDMTGWTDMGSGYSDMGSSSAVVGSAAKHGGTYSVGGGFTAHQLYQDVDVSKYAAFIDSGLAKVETGLWMYSGPILSAADKGRFVASFHYPNVASFERYDTGHVAPTTWTQYDNERLIPTGIRKIRAWHTCAQETGTTSDCYADDLVVRVKVQRYPASATVVYGRIFPEKVNWGALSWSGILPPGTSITCSARSSESGLGGWGAWSTVKSNGDDISSLAGVTDGHKAIEIKFNLGSAGVHAPAVTSFLLHY